MHSWIPLCSVFPEILMKSQYSPYELCMETVPHHLSQPLSQSQAGK